LTFYQFYIYISPYFVLLEGKILGSHTLNLHGVRKNVIQAKVTNSSILEIPSWNAELFASCSLLFSQATIVE
jgi:hypothetical protein